MLLSFPSYKSPQFIQRYGAFIDRDRAIEFGHKKMRHITEGISAIEKARSIPA